MANEVYYVGDAIECHRLEVFCDGERLDKVVAFSFDGDFAECATVDHKGDEVMKDGEFVTHKVYGYITVGRSDAK